MCSWYVLWKREVLKCVQEPKAARCFLAEGKTQLFINVCTVTILGPGLWRVCLRIGITSDLICKRASWKAKKEEEKEENPDFRSAVVKMHLIWQICKVDFSQSNQLLLHWSVPLTNGQTEIRIILKGLHLTLFSADPCKKPKETQSSEVDWFSGQVILLLSAWFSAHKEEQPFP